MTNSIDVQSYLDQIGEAYEKSSLNKESPQWSYSLCTTVPEIGQPIIVGINWGDDGHYYPAQTAVDLSPETPWGKMGSLNRLKKWMSHYFSDLPLSKFNQTNICFFRTPKADRLMYEDYELCLPIFSSFIADCKPCYIFGLGDPVIDAIKSHFSTQDQLDVDFPRLDVSARIFQAILKIDGWWTFVNVLPHPITMGFMSDNARSKSQILELASSSYPIELELTEFLNFLESQGVHPELSPDPLSEWINRSN